MHKDEPSCFVMIPDVGNDATIARKEGTHLRSGGGSMNTVSLHFDWPILLCEPMTAETGAVGRSVSFRRFSLAFRNQIGDGLRRFASICDDLRRFTSVRGADAFRRDDFGFSSRFVVHVTFRACFVAFASE